MSVSSHIVTSPSPRISFSSSSAGFATYSLVCASSRRSQSKPALGVAGLGHRARQDHAEDGAHGAAGDRIADQHLAAPARVEQIVPVRGGLLGGTAARCRRAPARCGRAPK